MTAGKLSVGIAKPDNHRPLPRLENNMAYRKCTVWNSEESITALCPYCNTEDEYCGPYGEDDIIKCYNKRCKKKFRLGQESG